MSVAGELKPPAMNRAWPRRFLGNARDWFALLCRAPRPAMARPAWRSPLRLGLGALLALAIIAGTMVLLDRPTIMAVGGLPEWVIHLFNEVTDYGTSDWFLVPIGLALAIIAALASPALSHVGQLVTVALTVRLGFVFAAIALPGLFVTIAKRLIGRARPFIGGDADPFHYMPFIWRPDYASLPSGHATNVFAALVAVGLVWPRSRGIMAVYALTIAVSRVIVLAHHPSDVIAGAVVGSAGALMVRDWFAARRLGFVIEPDGGVRALPGPSWRRLKTVARQFAAA
ncbi:MAG TPA: phosphatase PAP2 family protein [Xanthobacteraceae bacterium]|nr:phosphatase PAP2 family protein [Xanthobacteraceae bacterium]